MSTDDDYWFPAKRYGFGWGLPVRWQGWLVLFLWMVTFFAGVRGIGPIGSLRHVLFMAGMIVLLVWICWLKGERPAKWRWGDRD